jgi:hypothetical protein
VTAFPQAAVVAACCAFAGCAENRSSAQPDTAVPKRVVTPLCSAAHPRIDVELTRVVPDLRARKPSLDVKHYLVDVRVRGSASVDLWLLIDEETVPSSVDSVGPDEDDTAVNQGLPPESPRGWWFSGDDVARAWPLEKSPEISLTNIELSTGERRIPLTLGTIVVDGVSPEEWLRRQAAEARASSGDARAQADFEPFCTTWAELAAGAETSPPVQAAVPSESRAIDDGSRESVKVPAQ